MRWCNRSRKWRYYHYKYLAYSQMADWLRTLADKVSEQGWKAIDRRDEHR